MNHKILNELIEKWGEYLEMEDSPEQLTIEILVNTIEKQRDHITFLEKLAWNKDRRNGMN